MDDFEFRDPQFISASASDLNLSIQVAAEFISFAIQEKAGNKILYLKHIPFESVNSWVLLAEKLEKIIDSLPESALEFATIKMMWVSEKYTLVPIEYSDELYLKKLFRLVHPMEELDELHLIELPGSGYNLLFSFPQEIAHELKKHWPAIKIFQQMNPLHLTKSKINPKPEGFSVFLQVYPSFSDIIVYENGILKLANSFPLHEKTDLVYNLLNICNHFEIDPSSDSIAVTDHYFHGLTGHDALKKYFQNIYFDKPRIPEGGLSIFQAQDLDRYVNLLNLINCE